VSSPPEIEPQPTPDSVPQIAVTNGENSPKSAKGANAPTWSQRYGPMIGLIGIVFFLGLDWAKGSDGLFGSMTGLFAPVEGQHVAHSSGVPVTQPTSPMMISNVPVRNACSIARLPERAFGCDLAMLRFLGAGKLHGNWHEMDEEEKHSIEAIHWTGDMPLPNIPLEMVSFLAEASDAPSDNLPEAIQYVRDSSGAVYLSYASMSFQAMPLADSAITYPLYDFCTAWARATPDGGKVLNETFRLALHLCTTK